MATPRSKLSKFILSFPRTLPASQVVARAKAKGLKTSDQNVYRVRNMVADTARPTPAVSKPQASKPQASKAPASKSSGPAPAAAPSANKLSKSDFIRSQPASMAAKALVAKAKAAGLSIRVNQVYKVRGYDKTAAKTKVTKVAARRGPSTAKSAPAPRPAAARSSVEDLLRAVAAEIGLQHAMEILAGERARVRAVIGG
jgi:hypothetical protein